MGGAIYFKEFDATIQPANDEEKKYPNLETGYNEETG